MRVRIEASSEGPVDVAARAWRWRGVTRLTAITKATFRIKPDRSPELVKPAGLLVRTDTARTSSPHASIRRASECALFLRRPEIALEAVAFAAKGKEVEETKAALALARGSFVLFSKELRILGDRTVLPGDAPGRPMPFHRMPIVYERAYGGPGHPDNPAGTGTIAGGGRISMPNIVLGIGARAEPAGFGPIANHWPRRAGRLAGVAVTEADHDPFVDLPDGFDDAYFQSVPLDQAVESIAPGDVLTFTGLHPEMPTLRTVIPEAGAAAFVDRRAGRTPIPLRIESVFVEPHTLVLEIVFRGYVEVGDNELDAIRVIGSWHEAPTVKGARTAVPLPEAGPRGNSATMVLELPPPVAVSPEKAGTMIIEPAPAFKRGNTMPLPPQPLINQKPIDDPPPPSLRRDRRRREATLELSVDAPPRSLPFDRRGAKHVPTAEPATPALEGTPWTHETSKPVHAVDPRMQSTMIVEVDVPKEPSPPALAKAPVNETPRAEPPAVPPPADVEGLPQRKKAVWGNHLDPLDPPAPKAATPKQPRQQVPAGPDPKARLYGKFKR